MNDAALFPSPLEIWIGFNAGVLLLLAADQFLLHRTARSISSREAILTSAGWVLISLAFGAFLWRTRGHEAGLQFLTGYLVEYSLSADNVFIFVLIFIYFQVPGELQHRVLFWGVIGAMVLRGMMIGLGALLLAKFHWVLYLFGIFLLITGLRMLFQREKKPEIESNPLLRFCRRHLRISETYQGSKFLARDKGRLMLTPLALVLIMVESIDLLFAVDSIPAVFAITQDALIVYTSNICAILGLRSLYFLLAGAMNQMRYLQTGLALVLAFIGAKMLVVRLVEIPNAWSLGIVTGILLLAMLASRLRPAAP